MTCDFCGSTETDEVEVHVSGRRVTVDICADDRHTRTVDEILERGKVAVVAMRPASNRALDARIRA